MQLPYELKRYVKTGQNVKLTLPGGKAINGLVKSFMPTVDTVAQILSPKFTSNDKIILTGNYGLPDTAKIKIVAP